MNADRHDLIQSLAHDLTNPLGSVAGFLGMLLDPREKEALSPRQKRMIVSANRAAVHALGMLRDMADLSRLEEGAWKPKPSTVDVGAAARRAVEELRPTLTGRGTTLTVEMDKDAPAAQADEGMIGRFFDALLRSAERMIPSKQPLTVRLGRSRKTIDGELTLETDMSADDMESVMKTGVSDARPARGYAMMGFAFARRVAEAQGGSLTAESVDDGRIRLKFQFPRTAA